MGGAGSISHSHSPSPSPRYPPLRSSRDSGSDAPTQGPPCDPTARDIAAQQASIFGAPPKADEGTVSQKSALPFEKVSVDVTDPEQDVISRSEDSIDAFHKEHVIPLKRGEEGQEPLDQLCDIVTIESTEIPAQLATDMGPLSELYTLFIERPQQYLDDLLCKICDYCGGSEAETKSLVNECKIQMASQFEGALKLFVEELFGVPTELTEAIDHGELASPVLNKLDQENKTHDEINDPAKKMAQGFSLFKGIVSFALTAKVPFALLIKGLMDITDYMDTVTQEPRKPYQG